MMFDDLTGMELLIFATEATSTGDKELAEEIYEEIKRRNNE